MPVTDEMKITDENLEENLKSIREEISKLNKLVIDFGLAKFSEVAGNAHKETNDSAATKDSRDETSAQGRTAFTSIEKCVVEKPMQSIFIAFLIGLFIGSMPRR